MKKEKKSFLSKIDFTDSTVSCIIFLVVVVVIFTLLNHSFLTLSNVRTIFLNASIYAIFGISLTFMLISGAIDMSFCANAAMSVMFMAKFNEMGLPLWLCLIICLAIGGLGGLVNGILIAKIRIPALVATVGTQFIFRALAYAATNTKTINISDAWFRSLGIATVVGIPALILIMALFYLIFYFVLEHTSFGRKVYAIGGNRTTAYLNGIKIYSTQFITYIISGVLAAAGGILTTATTGFATATLQNGQEFTTLSGCIMGGISLSGGKGKLLGSLLGIILTSVIKNGMVLIGIQSYWQDFTMGVVMILAIGLDVVRNRKLLDV